MSGRLDGTEPLAIKIFFAVISFSPVDILPSPSNFAVPVIFSTLFF